MTVSELIKPLGQWHFRFLPLKRIIISQNKKDNLLIKDEVYYYVWVLIIEMALQKGGKPIK